MKVYLAADHGGFFLKEKIKEYLESLSQNHASELYHLTFEDLGPARFEEDDDYPDYILPLVKKVVSENLNRQKGEENYEGQVYGLAFSQTGSDLTITANKIKGARAVTSWSAKHARQARFEDDANILSLPADYLSEEEAKDVVKAFLTTPFSDEVVHKRRLKKIEEYEN